MYKEIIEEILKVYNLNASEFAEKIEVQRSGISHILSGRNNPSIDFLIKVKEQFPDIEWDYLIRGNKPMLVTNVNKNDKPDYLVNIQPTLFAENENKEVDTPKNKKPHHVKKIVWFYYDNTFEVFYPED